MHICLFVCLFAYNSGKGVSTVYNLHISRVAPRHFEDGFLCQKFLDSWVGGAENWYFSYLSAPVGQASLQSEPHSISAGQAHALQAQAGSLVSADAI